ncbi:MAG: hypothetical protein ACD_76C00106G0020 [uncultured bacterium]|nr:MAG: hypothetical protein ACD_76C00106G0020 [uncultured bacterium]HBD05578.1 alanine--tRNA ligase [Candidatus Uhrbacteria bacterium]
MNSYELREKFLEFFKSKGHAIIPSASVIPENDPSVLFTTAGMHPLVPYLLGEKHPQGVRLADYQKCVRTGDIDEVGDNTHLTFFEMLGNWSLGDYFKKESIEWSFEFLTSKDWLNVPIENLAITVFSGDSDVSRDDESAGIWLSLGIPKQRIAYLGKNDNWWPAGGKHTGPQGPDTEIFYWTGNGPAPEKFDPENKNWVEIWNNVFMEFEKKDDGSLVQLSQKNVDTGMGLERATAVLQGKKSVYETDLFDNIILSIGSLSGKKYGADEANDKSIRIIADHIRAAVFILGDRFGVTPSNVDQGYVLRRLIRRAVRHCRNIGINQNCTVPIAQTVIDGYCKHYPELKERERLISNELAKEEVKFRQTLEHGLKEFEKIILKTSSINGENAFLLYSTYGFPLELTEELAKERGMVIDKDAFSNEFKKHQELSRAGSSEKFAGGLADHSKETALLHSATHLLHSALRAVLGDHVEQKGSNITSERLRFDFSHNEKMSKEQIERVEKIVNDFIKKDLPVKFEILTVDEAKKQGAIGLFEDKYSQIGGGVKVYFIGNDALGYASKEICGGPHAQNLGELGEFRIIKEEASSAGVRRIKAVLKNSKIS